MTANTTIIIDSIISEAKQDEAKTLYFNHKASCNCPDPANCNCPEEWDTLTLTHGGSAHCVLSGNTITVTFTDGTVSTYTHDGSPIVPDANLTLQIVETPVYSNSANKIHTTIL
jgi:hypothetical protein